MKPGRPRIFVSYRRADSEAITGRIAEHLVARYGQDQVKLDIDSIPFGFDFRDSIDRFLSATDVVVVVVGPDWCGRSDGRARIQDETDYVRKEVEVALERKLPIVPVLVGNAVMPSPEELPTTLADFAYRNAVPLSPGRDFNVHISRLFDAIDKIVAIASLRPAPQPQKGPTIGLRLSGPPARRILRFDGSSWVEWIKIKYVIIAGIIAFALLVGLSIFRQPERRISANTVTSERSTPRVVTRTNSEFLIRIFKEESELELWHERDGKIALERTIPLCRWGGFVGTKTNGANQAPEGFYFLQQTTATFVAGQHGVRSLAIRYPNVLDERVGRVGFGAAIISDCAPECCYALTNDDFDYIVKKLSNEIAEDKMISVHAFPFRFTEERFRKIATEGKKYVDFWRNLEGGYSFVELTARIPDVYVYEQRYIFRERDATVPSGAVALY